MSASNPIGIDLDPDSDDSDIEIISHKPPDPVKVAAERTLRRASLVARNKAPEILNILSDNDESTSPGPSDSKKVSKTSKSYTAQSTKSQLIAAKTRVQSENVTPVSRQLDSFGLSRNSLEARVKSEVKAEDHENLVAIPSSSTIQQTLKRSGSEDVQMQDAQSSSPEFQEDEQQSSDTDDFWDDEYTVADALREYPFLNQHEVYERLAEGGIETAGDIYHKIIQPKILELAINERKSVIQSITQLAKKPRPLLDDHSRLMPHNSAPPRKPSRFAEAHQQRFRQQSAFHQYRNSPLRDYNIFGRRIVPNVFRDWKWLRMVHRSREAPGPINQISQSENIIAIGAATFDGNTDDPPSVHNRGPSLMFWKNGPEMTPMINHSRRFVEGELAGNAPTDDSDEDNIKHYTVNDVKFDPQNPRRAVSCASDNRILVWDFKEEDKTLEVEIIAQVELDRTVHSDASPQEIHYRSDSIMSVVGSDGSVYVYRHSDIDTVAPLRLSLIGEVFVAACVWGEKASHNTIFTSWQPKSGTEQNPYYHKAFDIRTGYCIHKFCLSKDPGSAIAISPDGQRLALATHGSEGHKIHLHDVRTRAYHPLSTVTLYDFEGDRDVEHMVFDPYGDYLAIGRTDNLVQIWDSRMNKLLQQFHHAKSIARPNEHTYGITGLRWITGWQGIGLRLFSGGDDGCVRIWNPQTKAHDFRKSDLNIFNAEVDPINGFEVAQEMNPIGHFAVGKTGQHDNKEMALVVGDAGGQISIYDRVGTPYFTT